MRARRWCIYFLSVLEKLSMEKFGNAVTAEKIVGKVRNCPDAFFRNAVEAGTTVSEARNCQSGSGCNTVKVNCT